MTGKKTIVTGGDSGIGRAAAVMFAMEGADVRSSYSFDSSYIYLLWPKQAATERD